MSANTDSDRARWAAIRLLRWYPRPWRMRYEQEMLVLLEEIPVGWKQVANIAATAVREWLSPRALGWPARSAAGRLLTVRTLTFMTYAYAIDGVARVTAARMINGHVSISDEFDTWATALMAVPLLRITQAGVLRMKRVQRSRWALRIGRHPWLQYLSSWEVLVLLLLYFPYFVIRYAEPRQAYETDTMWALKPLMNIYLVWVFAHVLVRGTGTYRRIRRIQLASMNRPTVSPPSTPGYWP